MIKKCIKRALSSLVAICVMTLALISPASASVATPYSVGNNLLREQQEIDRMTNTERNAYISKIASEVQTAKTSSMPGQNTKEELLRLAWYAAAKIVEAKFPCASILVQCSVFGIPYIENGGRISYAILNSSEYKDWAIDYKDESLTFNSGDLYYAIHNAYIKLVSHSARGGVVQVDDTFDFAFDFEFGTDLGTIFNTFVNDWGWLSQQMGVLTAIKVSITFTDPLFGTYSLRETA